METPLTRETPLHIYCSLEATGLSSAGTNLFEGCSALTTNTAKSSVMKELEKQSTTEVQKTESFSAAMKSEARAYSSKHAAKNRLNVGAMAFAWPESAGAAGAAGTT